MVVSTFHIGLAVFGVVCELAAYYLRGRARL